jgi:hypothetical protein
VCASSSSSQHARFLLIATGAERRIVRRDRRVKKKKKKKKKLCVHPHLFLTVQREREIHLFIIIWTGGERETEHLYVARFMSRETWGWISSSQQIYYQRIFSTDTLFFCFQFFKFWNDTNLLRIFDWSRNFSMSNGCKTFSFSFDGLENVFQAFHSVKTLKSRVLFLFYYVKLTGKMSNVSNIYLKGPSSTINQTRNIR